MKKYLNVIISAGIAVIGIIGVLICVIPSVSGEYAVIDKYVSAIDACDYDKIIDCWPLEEYEKSLGTSVDELLSDYTDDLPSATKMDYLKLFAPHAANQVPDDAKSVESIKLVSCGKKEPVDVGFTLVAISGAAEVEAVLQVTYLSADDEEVSFTYTETFGVLETKKGFRVVGW